MCAEMAKYVEKDVQNMQQMAANHRLLGYAMVTKTDTTKHFTRIFFIPLPHVQAMLPKYVGPQNIIVKSLLCRNIKILEVNISSIGNVLGHNQHR